MHLKKKYAKKKKFYKKPLSKKIIQRLRIYCIQQK
jgi:hypothetical protein